MNAIPILFMGAFGALVVWNEYLRRSRTLRWVVSLEDAKSQGQVLVLPEDLHRLPREGADNVIFEGVERAPSWPGRMHGRQLDIGRHYLAVLATDGGTSFAILRQHLAVIGLQHRLVDGAFHVWVRFYFGDDTMLDRHFMTRASKADVAAALDAAGWPFRED